MKKATLVFVLLFTSLFLMFLPTDGFAAQYEFDESFTSLNGKYTFSTTFREQTKLDILDLNIGMSYMQSEDFDAFKAHAKAGFNFWESGSPYCEMAFDDHLDYKRVGAGYEHRLRTVTGKYAWELFKHSIRVGAAYDSSRDGYTWTAGYSAGLSIPSATTLREIISIRGEIGLNDFGEKYNVDGEYRLNEQLSIYGSYETERIDFSRNDTLKQGIRVRI